MSIGNTNTLDINGLNDWDNSPDFALINASLDKSEQLPAGTDKLWNHFFQQYFNKNFNAVKLKNVLNSDDGSYYISLFREQLKKHALIIRELDGENAEAIINKLQSPSDEEHQTIDAILQNPSEEEYSANYASR